VSPNNFFQAILVSEPSVLHLSPNPFSCIPPLEFFFKPPSPIPVPIFFFPKLVFRHPPARFCKATMVASKKRFWNGAEFSSFLLFSFENLRCEPSLSNPLLNLLPTRHLQMSPHDFLEPPGFLNLSSSFSLTSFPYTPPLKTLLRNPSSRPSCLNLLSRCPPTSSCKP
jgi:hypothetical protein